VASNTGKSLRTAIVIVGQEDYRHPKSIEELIKYKSGISHLDESTTGGIQHGEKPSNSDCDCRAGGLQASKKYRRTFWI